jgi:hypothetical protein
MDRLTGLERVIVAIKFTPLAMRWNEELRQAYGVVFDIFIQRRVEVVFE